MTLSGFKFSELELSKYLRVWADVKFTDGLCRGRPVCAPREIHPRAWTRDLLGDGRYLGGKKGGWGQPGFKTRRVRFVWLVREYGVCGLNDTKACRLIACADRPYTVVCDTAVQVHDHDTRAGAAS